MAIFRFFKMAATAILDFQNVEILGWEGSRGSKCINMPKFATVGYIVAETWRFLDFFQVGGLPPYWICDARV